ncbi:MULTISPECIES: transglutaminase domain-containing protein [Bacillaceae]|uniref:DUF5050 domain-containing protein n=1 Tax=Evansella alkalicola TaxID=745819 RepID=A0ABS6JXG6_9BACI|nr:MULTISPECIES: transglutaminase domain-containing protein [Bacillaceae]MBU9723198.1 DUF5050 domain-containing protein [Bacillus alkalicola]
MGRGKYYVLLILLGTVLVGLHYMGEAASLFFDEKSFISSSYPETVPTSEVDLTVDEEAILLEGIGATTELESENNLVEETAGVVGSAGPTDATNTTKVLATVEDGLYAAILEALLEMKTQINVGAYSLDSDEVFGVRMQVLEDNPEIFYFEHQDSSFWTNGTLEFNYKYSRESISEAVTVLENKVSQIIEQAIKPGMSDLEKILALHDYIVLNTTYDYDNYLNGTIPDESYTSYGALILGTAVCDGYTKALNLLLREAGIETRYVTGKGNGEPHAWSLVQLDGEWFHIDATWNDPVPDRAGQVRYKYFLVSDHVLAQDHSWDTGDLPRADSNRFSYFNKIESGERVGTTIYYTDDESLLRMDLSSGFNQKIANVRAYDIAVDGEWLFFSNYSNGGYLYKIRKDGSELTNLNTIHSREILIEDGLIYFTDQGNQHRYYMEIR